MAAVRLRQTVLDATDVRAEAEFWRQFLGLVYRGDSEPPASGPDRADWLVLHTPDGGPALAIQQVAALTRTTWPAPAVPQQLHLDCTVSSVTELHAEWARALRLGATEIIDRSTDPEEPLVVLADPAGHPFCVFVV